ncbi:hypothetical protein KAI37_02545 [Paenibacillus sp. S25]|nr:hypothetical protein KAI37_02545 [Paenibacillus sp. S25]
MLTSKKENTAWPGVLGERLVLANARLRLGRFGMQYRASRFRSAFIEGQEHSSIESRYFSGFFCFKVLVPN